MKPKTFNGCNIVYGKDQPQYQQLPAQKTPEGLVITCWELTEEEIAEIVKNKCFYIQLQTFNTPLQPIMPVVNLGDDLTLNLDEN